MSAIARRLEDLVAGEFVSQERDGAAGRVGWAFQFKTADAQSGRKTVNVYVPHGGRGGSGPSRNFR